jgi:hypothetical protein
VADSSNENNGWTTYGKLVLSELERLQNEQDKTNIRVALTREKDLPELRTEIATLKTKAAIYGAIAGAIFSAIAFAVAELIINTPHPPH